MGGKLIELYCEAEKNGVDVDWVPMMECESLSVELSDGSMAIAIDPWKMDTIAKESVCLAHELGHCETGSFYNPYTPFDVVRKHENRADKWAIKNWSQRKNSGTSWKRGTERRGALPITFA